MCPLKLFKFPLFILVFLTFTSPTFAVQSDYSWYLKAGDKSPKWNEFIEPGFSAFDAGNLSTAYVLLNKAYELGCRDALLLYRLAIYKESRGQAGEAAQLTELALQKIQTQYPNHPLALGIHEHAGRILYKNDNFEGALAQFEQVVGKIPDNLPTLFMAGQCARILKKFDKAKEFLERALKLPGTKSGTDGDENTGQIMLLKLLSELMAVSYGLKDAAACVAYADEILKISPTDKSALSYKQKSKYLKSIQEEKEKLKKIMNQ